MDYQYKNLPLEGLAVISFPSFADDRGKFQEIYKRSEFQKFGLPLFVQDNYSHSRQGVLRGLHYQLPPKAQGKLVVVLEGEIFDVAVDLRRDSKTFKQWHGVVLEEGINQAFYVPPGFAHGFMVLSETASVLYKTTAEYAPELERGIIWNDPELNINWPMPSPKLKQRDGAFPKFSSAEVF